MTLWKRGEACVYKFRIKSEMCKWSIYWKYMIKWLLQDLYQAIIPRSISALGCVSGWYPIHIWKRPCKGRHLYAVFVLICLACFMICIFLCCMLFYCFNIDVSVFIFGKKLCRAYVIMLYTCRIKIKFSYLILCINLYISNPSFEKSTVIACINKNN
jgi:hypothetical protein